VELATVEVVFSCFLGVKLNADFVFFEIHFNFRYVFEFSLGIIEIFVILHLSENISLKLPYLEVIEVLKPEIEFLLLLSI